jgi:hypothetical protein
MSAPDEQGTLEDLLRWEAAGGGWDVAAETQDELTLALLTCDRGERVGTLVTRDPAALAHVRARRD